MMDFTTFLSFSYKYLFIEIPRDGGIEFVKNESLIACSLFFSKRINYGTFKIFSAYRKFILAVQFAYVSV